MVVQSLVLSLSQWKLPLRESAAFTRGRPAEYTGTERVYVCVRVSKAPTHHRRR